MDPGFPARPVSVKLWPPSQGTRLMLVERMTKNFTTPSIIFRKCGRLTKAEAEDDAKRVEWLAFAVANQQHEKQPDVDGSSAVQVYAEASSRLMLEVLKRGPRAKEEEGEMIKIEQDEAGLATTFDISGGRRDFISGEEAEELLKPLKEPGNSYTKLCFSSRSFGLDAAGVARTVLLSIKDQLKEVDLSDFVAGSLEAEALSNALEGSNLRYGYLNLSNNRLGEKGLRAFVSLLKSQNNLEELYLINDGISEEAARAVCQLIPSTEKLRVQFHKNMTGDEGAFAISEIVRSSSLLEDFRCSLTRMASDGGVALAEALGACTHLKKLDLRDNMFGVTAGLALSKAISAFADLTEIYLSYLNLEDEGVEALGNALIQSAPSLEVLEMAGNDITAKGAASLAACIASKQFLKKLNLAENELKDEGAIVIAKAIDSGHGQLIEVDLSTNAIRRAGARSLAYSVVNKPGFKLLNINGNFISDEGVDEVQDIFKNLPDVLGPLDENDPEGEDFDEEADEKEDEDELDLKLEGLGIKHED